MPQYVLQRMLGKSRIPASMLAGQSRLRLTSPGKRGRRMIIMRMTVVALSCCFAIPALGGACRYSAHFELPNSTMQHQPLPKIWQSSYLKKKFIAGVNRKLCSGEMTPAEVQSDIKADWTSLYQVVVGPANTPDGMPGEFCTWDGSHSHCQTPPN